MNQEQDRLNHGVRSHVGERVQVLTRQEQYRLADVIASSPPHSSEWIDARNALVESILPFVRKIAAKYRGRLEFADAYQAGVEGAIHAAELFRSEKQRAITTYSFNWIRTHVQRRAWTSRSQIEVPHYLSYNQRKRVDPSHVEKARIAFRAGQVLSEDENESSLDSIEDHRTPNPLDLVDAESESLDQLFTHAKLTQREADLLSWRFGLNGDDGASLASAGARVGITRERARQIQEAAIVKLRKAAVGLGLADASLLIKPTSGEAL